MRKLFPIVAATLAFAIAGTGLIAHSHGEVNIPAIDRTSSREARAAIVRDVIDGRLSLLEAATAFRDVNRRSPGLAEAVLQTYPAESEGESVCQEVLVFVRTELAERAKDAEGESSIDPAAVVLGRLEAELEAAKGAEGVVHLAESAN